MNKYIITLILSFGFCQASLADTLIIDRISQEKDIHLPQRGMSMEQVSAEFGEPEIKHASVGSPPIIKWDYSNFTVYFETNKVITAVVNKTNDLEKGPRPAIKSDLD